MGPLPPERFVHAHGLTALAVIFLSTAWTIVTQATDWPQWRGPNRDGVWTESGVIDSLPATGIPVRWRSPVGFGWSSPVVSEGKVFVTDAQLESGPAQERMHCFDEATGKTIWTYAYEAAYPDWSREADHRSPPAATPIVEADRLYMIGGNGHVHCLATSTGKVLWEKQLGKEYEIQPLSCRPSPLIESDVLIVLTGGKPGACVAALDKMTGRLVWKSLNESVSNSSPLVISAGGTRQLLVWTGESVTSLAPATGEVHWREQLFTSNNDSIATPVVQENALLVSGFMFDLRSDKAAASPRWPKSRAVARRVLSNTSTPLLAGDYIYAAKSSGELVCLDTRTGNEKWITDQVTTLKSGASIHLTPNGDRVWLFTDEGNLILARLTPAGYHELGRSRLVEPTTPFSVSGKLHAWVPPAYADRCIFARNDKEVVCASLAAKK